MTQSLESWQSNYAELLWCMRNLGFSVSKLRPDLDVVFADEYLMIDVVVTHPVAPSRKSIYPLAAAEDWERRTVRKYASHAAIRGATVLGFSLEIFGSWSKRSRWQNYQKA